ncbi:MAG: hypothetical protein K0U98_24385 [Deltaproteobacteria bacterium]|nr:hypothetical protein [Deltaproteobacteria bacterium]
MSDDPAGRRGDPSSLDHPVPVTPESDSPESDKPWDEESCPEGSLGEDSLFTDRDLRAAWRSLAEEAGSGERSTVDEKIWQASSGHSSKEIRQGLVDRLVTDVAAAESWRLATELQRELQAAEAEEASRERCWPRLLSRQGGLAAAALVISAIGVGLMTTVLHRDRSDPPEQVFRQVGDLEIQEIHNAASEHKSLPRDRAVLRWSSSSPEGARYTLKVFRSNLDPILVLRDLKKPEALLPESELNSVAEGERLLWQVEALLPNGRKVTSVTFFASLGPASGSSPSSP